MPATRPAQPAAKNTIAEIYNAEDKDRAAKAVRTFERQYGAKFPKVVEKITEDEGVLLALTFKLIESAQARWRTVNGPHLVALVRAGARFERGMLVARQDAAA